WPVARSVRSHSETKKPPTGAGGAIRREFERIRPAGIARLNARYCGSEDAGHTDRDGSQAILPEGQLVVAGSKRASGSPRRRSASEVDQCARGIPGRAGHGELDARSRWVAPHAIRGDI